MSKDKERIASKPYRWTDKDQSCEVVLRHLPQSAEPYVTHVYDSNKDSYFWGHYFSTLEEGLEDFQDRA